MLQVLQEDMEKTWQAAKRLVWDVTVQTTLADTYVASAARRADEVAQMDAVRKHTT